jgi:type II secretory pathway component PulC
MRDNNSPEEKLLKLIRGQKNPPQDIPLIKPQEEASAVTATYEKKRSFKSILRPPEVIKYLGLSYIIKKVIILLLGFSFLYVVLSFLYPFFGLQKIRMPKPLPLEVTKTKNIINKESMPYESYSGEIKKRNIFLNKGMGAASNPAVASADLVKNFNLIGIIAGNVPQAIIEDKTNNKVYYLNKGQYIGEFQVQDILEGKIILNYEGQSYELYL